MKAYFLSISKLVSTMAICHENLFMKPNLSRGDRKPFVEDIVRVILHFQLLKPWIVTTVQGP